jgi:hypothetical protein
MSSNRPATSTRASLPSARDSTTPGSHPDAREKPETYANAFSGGHCTSIVLLYSV